MKFNTEVKKQLDSFFSSVDDRLKDDNKNFRRAMHASAKDKPMKKEMKKGKRKFKKVMEEFKEGELHSGSKMGKLVTNPKQAVAIAYSEKRRANKKRK